MAVPLLPAVTVSQLALLVEVQPQPPGALTVALAVPPAATILDGGQEAGADHGDRSGRLHRHGECRTFAPRSRPSTLIVHRHEPDAIPRREDRHRRPIRVEQRR